MGHRRPSCSSCRRRSRIWTREAGGAARGQGRKGIERLRLPWWHATGNCLTQAELSLTTGRTTIAKPTAQLDPRGTCMHFQLPVM